MIFFFGDGGFVEEWRYGVLVYLSDLGRGGWRWEAGASRLVVPFSLVLSFLPMMIRTSEHDQSDASRKDRNASSNGEIKQSNVPRYCSIRNQVKKEAM